MNFSDLSTKQQLVIRCDRLNRPIVNDLAD